jgi:MFS family permease
VCWITDFTEGKRYLDQSICKVDAPGYDSADMIELMNRKSRSLPLICLIGAEFFSQLGNQIAAMAIPLLVLQFTHSPIATGIAGAGNLIPVVLAAFLGGKAIDRFGAWRVSVTADMLSGISVLLLPLAFIGFHPISPIAIFLLVFVGALFDPTAISARQTLIPKFARLAGRSLDQVNGYRGSLENGADLLGPVIGAGLIGWIGTVNTFFVNAVSFFICAALFAIAVPPQRHRPSNSETGSLVGIRFIFKHPQLRSLAVGGIALNFVLLPFLGLLLPVLTTQRFASPTLLGFCLSLFGLAATLGAFSYSILTRWLSRSVMYYGGLLLTAISIGLCAFVQTPATLMISIALGGLLLGAGNPLEQTILQEATPSKIAGQVFTSQTSISFAAGLFGLLVAGIATEWTTVHLVLSCGAALLAGVATIGWLILPLSVGKSSSAKLPNK